MLLLFIVLMPCWIMDIYNQRKKYAEEKVDSKQTVIRQNTISGPLTHSSLYVQNELSEFNNHDQKRNFKL
jgi:hypothetical protein